MGGALLDALAHLELLAPAARKAQLRAAKAAGVFGVVSGNAPLLAPAALPWAALGATAPAAADPSLPVIYRAVGVLPGAFLAAGDLQGQLASLATALAYPDVCAVGEVGLDSRPGMPPLALQEHWFKAQVALAVDCGKLLIIHNVRSSERLLSCLRGFFPATGGRWHGFVHGFMGPLEVGEALIKLGFALSFGPGLLNPNAKRVVRAAQRLPAHALLLESDCPSVAFTQGAGGVDRKTSGSDTSRDAGCALVYTLLSRLAAVRAAPAALLAKQLQDNAAAILGLRPNPPGC